MNPRRRQTSDVSPMGEGFLACCYALIGFSVAGLIVLRWTARQVEQAVTLPAPTSATAPAPTAALRAVR